MSTQGSSEKQLEKLSNLITYYELCNKSEGKSPKTVTWYSANLRQFHHYLQARHLPDSIADIDIQILREYILYLLKRNKFAHHPYTSQKQESISAATVHGHVRTLRAFFSWLVREGLTENDLGSSLKLPKVSRKIVSTLSDKEITSILSALNPTNPCDARNQTILMILLDTGLRIGELIGLRMDNLHLDQGFLKVMGKGRKERIVPIGKVVQRALWRYIDQERPSPADSDCDELFLSTTGHPITVNTIKLMFSRLARTLGVTRLHAHLCRHTFAINYLLNGGDIFSLQAILGHTTLEMVRHYLYFTSSQVAAQHHKYSPMDRLHGEQAKDKAKDSVASPALI